MGYNTAMKHRRGHKPVEEENKDVQEHVCSTCEGSGEIVIMPADVIDGMAIDEVVELCHCMRGDDDGEDRDRHEID